MKAFLLAAGFGTRLRPLTDTTPKCLVPIQGTPLLEWWLRLFEKHGITEVLINTHYLYEQVRDYIEKHNRADNKVKLVEAYEPELLGSGGTVRANFDFVKDESEFFICYADNLTNINLTEMLQFHKEKQGLLTMGLFRANHPEQCGIAELDENYKITSFIEKPEHPKGDLANCGVYIAKPEIISRFPKREFLDFGKDVLPELINDMYGWETKDYLVDIGTPENYKRVQEEWREL